MQSDSLMKSPTYTNLQSYRLLKPSKFQTNLSISLQIHFGGFLEPISMTRVGYTTKKEFSEFLSCFGVLAPEILSENNHEKIACLKILDKLDLTNYQIGETKVFLRAAHMAELVGQKEKVLERAAMTIQRPIHASMLRKEFLSSRKTAIDIQSLCRGMLIHKTYENRVKVIAEKKPQSLEVQFKLRKESEEASRIQVLFRDIPTSRSIMFLYDYMHKEGWLNQCILQNLGFSSGRPVAACMIYKFLLHWRFSEQGSNEKLAYWLSNSSALLLLLQRQSTANEVQLFKQKLRTFLEKIYGIIRENIKNEISPILALCIQIPRISCASMNKGKSHHGNHVGRHNTMVHWQSLTKSLANYFNILKANHVPPLLVHKLFTQVFSFINVQLFNSLPLSRECCSFSNGKYVQHGLTKLETWCVCTTQENLGSAWNELKHIRKAVEFLIVQRKSEMTLEQITNWLCPEFSTPQVQRISIMFWDDKHGTKSIAPEVLETLRLKTTVGTSFLLDDDSSIPFSTDEICKSMAPFETSDIHLPLLIRDEYRRQLSSIEERIDNIALIFSSA